ncbi:MAG: hypothetical protein GY928_23270 [Colwellia sp.]|nr:hypothetical protein [Colwellia sp.]
MYKDKKGEYICLNQVVEFNGGLWFIAKFCTQDKREYFVKLQNSCCFTYAKPEQLKSVTYVGDVL